MAATIGDNLVITTAIGYSDDQLAVFLSSLRQVGYAGKILLFSDNDKNQTIIDRFGALRIDVSRFNADKIQLPLNAKRFVVYQQFLNEVATSGRILLTDVRDVLFQRDPFDFPQANRYDLLFALEERAIGECGMNSRWISTRFGVGILRKLHGEIISCAGTVLGSYGGIRGYLKKMCEHLQGSSDAYGLDQGAHNVIIHLDKIENQRALLNGLGPIMTMHYMNKDALRFSEAGQILNYDGTIPNIVHQYDRLPEAMQAKLSALQTARGTAS